MRITASGLLKIFKGFRLNVRVTVQAAGEGRGSHFVTYTPNAEIGGTGEGRYGYHTDSGDWAQGGFGIPCRFVP
jgi:hypothetical protein